VRRTSAAFAALLILLGASCQSSVDPPRRRAVNQPSTIDDVEHRTFRFFWETGNPNNGLVPDRWPTKSFSSIAAVGFGLVAYGIGAERGYVTREAPDRQVIHSIPVGFSIDDSRGILDPRGMVGERLGVNMHIVTAAAASVRNHTAAIGRSHLEVEALVVSPYAAGLACLDEQDEFPIL